MELQTRFLHGIILHGDIINGDDILIFNDNILNVYFFDSRNLNIEVLAIILPNVIELEKRANDKFILNIKNTDGNQFILKNQQGKGLRHHYLKEVAEQRDSVIDDVLDTTPDNPPDEIEIKIGDIKIGNIKVTDKGNKNKED